MHGNTIVYESGTRFGRLTVMGIASERGRGRGNLVKWDCLCDCGNTASVAGCDLRNGTLSCGCLARERAGACSAVRLRKHGLSQSSSEYRVWIGIRQRCSNPNNSRYADYGGRGITVCTAWKSFEQFYADMGPRPSPAHSMDRIDNDGSYSPENCHWATRSDQGRNKRNNRLLTYEGLTLTVTEWAERLGVKRTALWARLDYGWPVERILTEPVGPSFRARKLLR